jgi:cobalt-precorrin-5B (C1)-methyltransferase
MLRDQHLLDEAEIILPNGETATFRLHGQSFTLNSACCYVIKDAGDDPDVTHGAEIHAETMLAEASGDGAVVIRGGPGVGRVTKPGLAIPVSEWAINPVPRRMITTAINEVLSLHCPLFTGHCEPVVPHVTISIANGEELAKKTLNARLGIVGGLSILGTTGIVKPISRQAWTDTIDASIDVALACGCSTLVLSTGRTSELAAQRFFSRAGKFDEGEMSRAPTPLSEESYIMMGDHVGHTLRACECKGVRNVILSAQFAKLLKIACGHEQTHVSSSRMDPGILIDWLKGSPRLSHLASLVSRSGTARHVFESSGKDPELMALVRDRAAAFAARIAPGLRLQVFLAGYGGEMVYFR